MKRFCVCLIALALAAVTTSLATGSKFTIDVFRQRRARAGDFGRNCFRKRMITLSEEIRTLICQTPRTIRKNDGLLPERHGFSRHRRGIRILDRRIESLSTETVKEKGISLSAISLCLSEEECWIINSDTAYKTMIYPVLDLRENRYFYDEYRLLAGYLLLPVEENDEKSYIAVDVIFGNGKDSYHGVITLDKNKELVMKPAK